jgi:hypothetical protein
MNVLRPITQSKPFEALQKRKGNRFFNKSLIEKNSELTATVSSLSSRVTFLTSLLNVERWTAGYRRLLVPELWTVLVSLWNLEYDFIVGSNEPLPLWGFTGIRISDSRLVLTRPGHSFKDPLLQLCCNRITILKQNLHDDGVKFLWWKNSLWRRKIDDTVHKKKKSH